MTLGAKLKYSLSKVKAYIEALTSLNFTGALTGTSATFSGTVSAGIPRVEKPAGGTLTAQQCMGCLVDTKGQTDDATLKLAPIAEGMHGTLVIETTVAKYYRLDPQDTEIIRFDDTVLTAGYYVGMASAVAGGKLVFMAEYSGTTLIWDVRTVSGSFAAQA